MADTPWTVKEFQRRRKDTWRSVRVFLILGFISAVGGAFFGKFNNIGDTAGLLLGLLSALLFFISILCIIYIIQKKYKCPSCKQVPMSGWANIGPKSVGYERGVDLNPMKCTNCGAQLR